MYFYFLFKSGLKRKILVQGNNGSMGLLSIINEAISNGKQFITINAEIIRLDAIETIVPAEN
jgi:hypothetical protein